MPRTYKRKSNRETTPADVMMREVETVINGSKSIRSVAEDFNICHVTLMRYVRKKKQNVATSTVGYVRSRQVFTDAQEVELCKYISGAAAIYFGLSPKEVRTLAYQCAVAFEITIPASWHERTCAGEDWFSSFLKRHSQLSIRVPEATSMSRATSFNRENVKQFFAKLSECMDRYKFTAADVWNVDETGITTVQKPRSIVATKGTKQVCSITSAERGTLVTMTAAVCAIGSLIPPMLIFPRKQYKDHFVRDGPVGCLGAANPSGWTNAGHFLDFVKHFVKHAKPTKEKPVLLLLDNHDSHLAIDVLNYAKESGVVMLSFPPHCSHKLQPLDRAVFGPLKRLLSAAQDAWMRNNPGKTMTIYDLPGIVRDTWPRAAVPVNVAKGFEVSAIFPFNANIFTYADFAPSSVTDRPNPEQAQTEVECGQPFQGTVPQHPTRMQAATVTPAVDQPLPPTPVPETQPSTAALTSEAIPTTQTLTPDAQEPTPTPTPDAKEPTPALMHDAQKPTQTHMPDTKDPTPTPMPEAPEQTPAPMEDAQEPTPTPMADAQEPTPTHVTDAQQPTPMLMRDAQEPTPTPMADATYLTPTHVHDAQPPPPTPHASVSEAQLSTPTTIPDAQPLTSTRIPNTQPSTPMPIHNAQPATGTPEPGPSHGVGLNVHFSPENVRPFPKAAPRKMTNRGCKKRKTAILTDTPEKRALEDEKKKTKAKASGDKKKETLSKKKKKKVKRKLSTSTKPAKKCKNRRPTPKARHSDSSEDEDQEWFCLVCVEPYSNSRSREPWVECTECHKWAHSACVSDEAFYICQNCLSEDSM